MSSPFLVSGLPHTALIVIDVQKAFLDPSFLGRERSTPDLEPNITALLAAFREKKLPIIHIHHVDTLVTNSEWNEETHPEGVLPQDYVTPQGDEPVLRKYDKSSAFGAKLVSDRTTSLKDVLDAQGIKRVILVGLSSPHCVSSSARSACDSGLSVVVVGDACATYATTALDYYSGAAKGDIKDGKAWSAETVHGVAMAHLDSGDLAHIVGTAEVLKFV